MTWQPGESGNPGGFRGKKPVSDAIAMELAIVDSGREDPVPARSLRAACSSIASGEDTEHTPMRCAPP
jgi:hypothetical protein